MKIAHFPALLLAALTIPGAALAQEADAGVTAITPAPEMPDGGMAMAAPLGLTHAREASGTSWQPDETPVNAIHLMSGGWMLMFHGMLHVGLEDMVGPRGDSSLFSTNWFMGTASRPLAGGQLLLKAMLSAEPVTVPASGYPLLLQTGETYAGQALHDRQHPHDLFMELAADYRHELGSGLAFELYLAPVGEPALGPTAYPHRESAALDMLAPLTHHHLDSTHLSYGAVTAAVYSRLVKLEGSAFNGREPDEERFDLDFAPIDSYSVRAQVAPLPELVAQFSYGYLAQPERQRPGVSQRRLTASATFDRRLGEGNLAATAAWAVKREAGESSNALLAEVNANLDGANSVFGRLEWVERDAAELALPSYLQGSFPVEEATLGLMHELAPVDGVRLGFGALGVLAFVPSELNPIYGGDAEPGILAFGRLRLVGQ